MQRFDGSAGRLLPLIVQIVERPPPVRLSPDAGGIDAHLDGVAETALQSIGRVDICGDWMNPRHSGSFMGLCKELATMVSEGDSIKME